jgi:hypothetical protein
MKQINAMIGRTMTFASAAVENRKCPIEIGNRSVAPQTDVFSIPWPPRADCMSSVHYACCSPKGCRSHHQGGIEECKACCDSGIAGRFSMTMRIMIPRHIGAMTSDVMVNPAEAWTKAAVWLLCFTTGISTLPNPRTHVTPRRLCSAHLRPGSASAEVLLTLLTPRGAVKTHLNF